MLRSILVALDDTPGAQKARDAAIGLARRTGAHLTAAVVLDRPHTQSDHEFVPIGGAAFKARRDAKLAERAEQDAAAALAACSAAAGDTPYEVLRLEDAPEPALLAAGATHDLIVVGRDCTLGREETEDGVAPVVESLLQDGARPLLVVCPGGMPTEGPVIVGYDGSIPVMAALQLFALLGLAEASRVHVASVAEEREAAEALAMQGVAYLRRHGIDAQPLPLRGERPVDLILAEAEALKARMIVAGAFEESALSRLFTGSATHALLREARVPVFMHR